MPELPEVETVRNTLKRLIIGRKIVNFTWTYDKIIKDMTIEQFKNKLLNQSFVDILRRGKFLYYIKSPKNPLLKHEHIVFHLDDGTEFRYHDTRKFGVMHLVDSTNLEEVILKSPIKKLGYEPFENDCTPEWLYNKIKNRITPIKSILLNQEFIAGLGNIYVDEVCFLSRLHPTEPACNLTLEDTKIIINNAIEVLNKAIVWGGTTIRSYTSINDVHGRFQNELMVHRRVDEKCHICQTVIKKIKVGGRGTYFCEKCQTQRGWVLKKT